MNFEITIGVESFYFLGVGRGVLSFKGCLSHCTIPNSFKGITLHVSRATWALHGVWTAVYLLLQCWGGNWAVYVFYWLGISIYYLKLLLFPYPLCELDVEIIVSGFLWHLHTNADSMWTQHPLEIIVWDHSHHYIWCIRSITYSQRSLSSVL